jgi:hypothetical protein
MCINMVQYNYMQRGMIGNTILILIGVVMVAILIGFFAK